jgi:hypothetical protein
MNNNKYAAPTPITIQQISAVPPKMDRRTRRGEKQSTVADITPS